MSEALESIILGLVQGLTEFLPVSSSGHLEIAKFLLGDTRVGEQSLVFTVVLHLATALATLVVFRKDIGNLTNSALKGGEGRHFMMLIVVSMVPAGLVGVFFEELIESLFSQQLLLVGLALIFTAVLLGLADRVYNPRGKVTWSSALLIGFAQAVAILPGVSRSGATIATAVLLKIDRADAARFSFLMVVPLILGKVCKDLISGDLTFDHSTSGLMIGFASAFFAGLLACTWMIRIVKAANLRYFGLYCLIVGLVAVISQLV